ncbi:bifunctional 3-(3-hydroxy-phenyl)propionate/3-hydroxycinnamic acid hydroxylase [Pseudomonas sp. SA3-5]|uniref:Bifunctional 3-(3-hydroxy-phenyl)propionate/3-hydroxycinnamic acid hydroxylase n=1 Tax=Pseudomonas aestuarii TaxID=3018340 RepID=A0ABT4XBH3_9PSED|nr:bifunctional 3-(3-hydroxy-phenyl)propionate/3-hydroxycinnamic acid hydroxylase [Pseudomonas aestuarii]MDA7085546.1 bifunctional 3-(3-hydroxy-phenyl)propionate/3-hydroxycinnamic acid hydroxylase [Pseudomonas aestuarii]
MTTLTPVNTDVLIIGAGPTGLTLANLLGQAGVRITIIERKVGTVTEPRAVSIDDESLRTMQAAGLDEAVLADVVKGYGVHYFDKPGGRCFGKVEPVGKQYGYPKRNAFRQPLFERTLMHGMERFPSLTPLFCHELIDFIQDASGVLARVQNEAGETVEVRAQYMVACDGGRSPVRKQLGIDMVGSSFKSRWLVVDLDQDDDPFWQTRVYCDAQRPVVEVPGPHQTRRFEFMLKDDETDEQMLRDASLSNLLRPFRGEKGYSLVRKVVYTFHARVASRWQAGRVFLAGDAAHLTPPYAGQGMNSGVRDAHNIAWKLVAVLRGQMAQSALDSYESERRNHAWALIKLALNLGVVMAPASTLRAKLITSTFRVIGLIPPLRDYFLQMKFKPKPRFTQGLVLSRGKAGNLRAGTMLPQPTLFDSQGSAQLLDEYIGPGFALIQYGDLRNQRMDQLQHPLWDHLEAKRIVIIPQHAPLPPPLAGFTIVHDRNGELSALFVEASTFLLLRPDRYVAAIFNQAQESETAQALQSMLGIAETATVAVAAANTAHFPVTL